MANPSDQSAEAGNRLPAPELNPLLNPILEENLGRWAQVYLTSPPEQRDNAVEELLRELQAQTPKQTAAPPKVVDRVAETPLPSTSQEPDAELEWLRAKNLSVAYEHDEGGPRWIWKVIAPILALVVVVFLYSQWKTRLTAEQHPAPAPAALSTAQRPSIPETTPAPTASQLGKPADIPSDTSQKALTVPVTNNAGNANAPETGVSELARAQDYLAGRNGLPRDSTAAVDWLWRAVRRENPTAEVLLADLYIRGDGVPRSCEQARLLLTAAAKRRQPRAADKLRDVNSGGCS